MSRGCACKILKHVALHTFTEIILTLFFSQQTMNKSKRFYNCTADHLQNVILNILNFKLNNVGTYVNFPVVLYMMIIIPKRLEESAVLFSSAKKR